MEKESLKTKPCPTMKDWSFNNLSFTLNLPLLIGNMKHSHDWSKGELSAMILFKKPGKQVLLTALREGTKINSFQLNDSITFQIIEGKIRFHSEKESVTVYEGQKLTVHDNIGYSLTSIEDTVFLSILANKRSQPA